MGTPGRRSGSAGEGPGHRGAGFIGSHVVDKLIDAGHEPLIFDLRPSPYHSPAEVEHRRLTSPTARRSSARRPAATRSSTWPRSPTSDDVVAEPARRERVNAQGTLDGAGGRARRRGQRVVYGSTTWVYSDCPERRRRGHAAAGAEPPLHRDQARRRALLQGLLGALRDRVHDPAVRDPLRATGARRRRDGRVRAPRPRRRAADAGRRRQPVAALRLRRGPRRGGGRRAAARGRRTASTTSPATRRSRSSRSPRRCASRSRDTGIVHTPARAGDFGGKEVSSERAGRELGWTATTPFAEGFRRYLDWRRVRNHAPARADPHRRHRRGPRPAGAGARRELATEPRGRGRGRRRAAGDGAADHAPGPRRILARRSTGCPGCSRSSTSCSPDFPPTRWLALRLLPARRGRRLRQADPAPTTPTWSSPPIPGTTAVLGELRRRGRLEVPVVSAITDLAGLRFWAHPGVDLHTVTHRESIEEVEAIAGPGQRALGAAADRPTSSSRRARRPTRGARSTCRRDGQVVVVSGGGWGIGDLAGAVDAALEIEASTVVCLSGHSERARRRLRAPLRRRIRACGCSASPTR